MLPPTCVKVLLVIWQHVVDYNFASRWLCSYKGHDLLLLLCEIVLELIKLEILISSRVPYSCIHFHVVPIWNIGPLPGFL
jgi:hypothetical protein